MALSISMQTNTGVQAIDAYLKLHHFTGNKDKIEAIVHVYYNQQARTEEKLPLSSLSFSIPTPKDNNILSAIYSYIKSLSEYSAAVDL